MTLYKFDKLSRRLDELGYDQSIGNGFKVMKRDLTKEAKAGNIEFRGDGVYLKIDGIEYKGYMYIKYPIIARFGYPKFHISECQVIQEQKDQARFNDRYYWQNTPVVTLVDMDSNQTHENVELILCNYCRTDAAANYNSTKGFFETISEVMTDNTEFEVDIYGYPISPINWYEISKQYRIEKNYTCEHQNCKIQITEALDKRFIHVHHKDGNKLNCNPENLECLCVLCHANADKHHLENFQEKRLQREIKAFLKKYLDQLRSQGNPYIKNL